MRMIDADALKDWIDEYVSVFKKSDTREIKGYIEHQPTIEPKTKVVAQVTFDEDKLREIVHEAVERFKEEYEIVDRPQGEWIPTSVRTPKDKRAVLVYEKNYRNIYTAYYDSVYGWMTFDPYSNECFGEHLDIIAWMPLPEPWKGADDE